MRQLLLAFAIVSGQLITHQSKHVVHLPANVTAIDPAFGGDQLDLINPPAVVTLPVTPPKVDGHGNPWVLDIKNLGPGVVNVLGKAEFNVQITVGQTVHIHSDGYGYSSKP
jgi:hypothetical protein